MLISYFNCMFDIWEWFNVNGYHLVMLSGVNFLRYMHILKEMRNFKWVFLEAAFKWAWPTHFIWVWADRRFIWVLTDRRFKICVDMIALLLSSLPISVFRYVISSDRNSANWAKGGAVSIGIICKPVRTSSSFLFAGFFLKPQGKDL